MTPEELAALRTERNRPPWDDAELEAPAEREPDPEELARNVPEAPAAELTSAFADASGLSAVADRRATVREAQAARLTGWPLTRAFGGTRQPAPGTPSLPSGGPRGGTGGEEPPVRGFEKGQSPFGEHGPFGQHGLAPQSEVDTAITTFADAVGGRLPEPWPGAMRRAVRSRADEVPPALAEAMRLPDPGRSAVPASWRLIAVWQWVLLVIAAVSVIGAVVIGVAHGPHEPAPLDDLRLIPWLVGLAVVCVLLGWLTAFSCRNTAADAADHERKYAEGAMRGRVTTVARNLVLAPAGQEIADYESFRRELSVARGKEQS